MRISDWSSDVCSSDLQARQAGELLKQQGFEFDLAYSSVLKRAIRTLWIALDAMDSMHTPTGLSWRLNERHYGALQGLNKAETAEKYGDEQEIGRAHVWTPVTNAHLVCRLLLEKQKTQKE